MIIIPNDSFYMLQLVSADYHMPKKKFKLCIFLFTHTNYPNKQADIHGFDMVKQTSFALYSLRGN